MNRRSALKTFLAATFLPFLPIKPRVLESGSRIDKAMLVDGLASDFMTKFHERYYATEAEIEEVMTPEKIAGLLQEIDKVAEAVNFTIVPGSRRRP